MEIELVRLELSLCSLGTLDLKTRKAAVTIQPMFRLKSIAPIPPTCLLMLILAGSLKADVIEDLTFAGFATCSNPALNPCTTFPSGPVTGNYSWDVTTQAIVGSWSFTVPFGVLSSNDAGASAAIELQNGNTRDDFIVEPINSYAFVSLTFPGANTTQIGSVIIVSDACIPSGVGASCFPDYDIAGATTLVNTNTVPEPAFAALPTLLGLIFILYRRPAWARAFWRHQPQ